MKRAIFTALAITTLIFPAVPVLAVSEDPLDPLAVYEEEGYQGGDYGRVRFQENHVTIVRAATGDLPEEEELATLNSPIYPGDSISTYADQRAEVQLAGGTLIRIDAVSQVTFQSLPDPYAEYPDNAIVQLAYGVVQTSARVTDKEEFRIDTPAASVYLLGDGDFRIEVDEDGRTRVLSRRGVAEIVSEGGSVLVRGGMRTTVYAGFVPDDPSSFNTFVTDDFDRWVRNREGTYRAPEGHVAAQEQEIEPFEDLPTEVKPYYSELSSHGRWVFVADYGYAWYPVGVASGWRPYHRGYWSFGPRGYFWVSHEPWGWAPYHFGRWSWVAGYGWIWIPGSVFSGAWVSWSYGPNYVGWCPLGYYDTPVRAGGIRFGFYGRTSWTFVSYTNLRHRDVHHYSVPVDHVGDEIRRHAVVTRPPKASPRVLGGDELSREREFVVARNDGRGRIPTSVERPRTTFRDNETVVTRRRVANPRRIDRSPGGGAPATGGTARVSNPTRPGGPGGGGSRPVQNRTATATTPPSGGSLSSAGGESTPTTRRRTTAAPGPRTPTRPVDRASPGRGQPTPGVRTPDGGSGTPSRRPAVENRSPGSRPTDGESGAPPRRPSAGNRSTGSRTPGGSAGGQIGRPERDTTATEPRDSRRPETRTTPGSSLSPTTSRKQTTSRARPDGDATGNAGSSVRDMYEKMSKPRTTERRDTPATGSGSKKPSTSRDQAGSGKNAGSDQRAAPRSGSGSDSDKGRSNGSSADRSKTDRSRSDPPSANRSNGGNRSNGSSANRSSSPSASRSSGGSNRSSGSSASRSGGSSNRSSGSSASRSSGGNNRSSGSSSSKSSGNSKSSSSGKKGSGRKR